MSQKHSNFLVNDEHASSLDIELLGEEIKENITTIDTNIIEQNNKDKELKEN